MFNRREIIASGLAAAVVARASAQSLSSPEAKAAWLPVQSFVADRRFPEARAAARAAAASGTSVMNLAADITGAYESLDLAWRSARFAVSGMTTPAALFVLERLAWERGLRTAYRGVHRLKSEGIVQHELTGSSTLVRLASDEPDRAWTSKVGRMLASWSPTGTTRREPALLAQMLPSADGTTLVSWLLTPKESSPWPSYRRM